MFFGSSIQTTSAFLFCEGSQRLGFPMLFEQYSQHLLLCQKGKRLLLLNGADYTLLPAWYARGNCR